MTEQQRGIILLIKSALTGESFKLPQGIDLGEVFSIAKTHGISALLYYGAHNCGVDSKSELMRENLALVYHSIMINERQDAEFNRIFAAFDEHEIEYMPLKGLRLRRLYPKSEMRRMGDADILIKPEQYEKIRPIMEELGYTEGVESDHELHWSKKFAHVELHKRLIPSYNKDYYAYFGDGWRLAAEREGNTFGYRMSREDEMIYLFTHFAKHYRDAGIGIRHLTDLWVYRRANSELCEDYIKTELEKLQLYEFYKNIIQTLAVWFEGAQCDEKSDFITRVIFNSGTFGKKENSALSTALKERKSGRNLAAFTRWRIFRSIFTDYENMCVYYPILEKFPVLLPFYWVAHFCRRLFKKNKVKNFVDAHLSISEDEITDYQKSLNYVGLDYNFDS